MGDDRRNYRCRQYTRGHVRADHRGGLVVVADVTVHNANVFYELGIRHALRKRRSVMIKGNR